MPREYALTALKPFDYEGRSFVEGESLRTGILGFIQLVGTFRARLERVEPESSVPLITKSPVKPVAKKRGRPRKKQA